MFDLINEVGKYLNKRESYNATHIKAIDEENGVAYGVGGPDYARVVGAWRCSDGAYWMAINDEWSTTSPMSINKKLPSQVSNL